MILTANKHLKKFSISIVIRRIKTTMKYIHLKPTRMAKIKKTVTLEHVKHPELSCIVGKSTKWYKSL